MIGRNYEINRLQNSLKSADSELIAVYGRRRVGKTFLIRNIYQDYIKFEVSGLYEGTKEKQLEVFFDELKKASLRFSDTPCPATWKEAFDLLKTYINGLRGKEKKVIFIDEMPWLDTHKSDFRMYFGHFWNTYCEKRNDLIVVVCGSAANLTIINTTANWIVDRNRLASKSKNTPFEGMELPAQVAHTFLNGKQVLNGGAIVNGGSVE
jgi:Cdc6-like AAA superfamily ATPase